MFYEGRVLMFVQGFDRPRYWITKNGMLPQKANEQNSGAMIYLREAR
jgi:hypothetical protein